ncbi:GumC family protein [Mucilaginibacter myungsuensis]|uniref:non-specific protein-tyrosine kinase n=1 Tax=Mucilaginibacter myungsuensis TaxID=649104 RepID=A0A929PUW6_9SPHI|nr:polysaccharide biosynthesis tyrosine autokinase [Mucilaginibacter myungsuensis]MBE9660381.1 polysaccharide biosynthesis tyrosine autokinase [Mucilaginibacter myungsuensis]MDN3600423.1 polysaccharide biosynthesis tyrosine autokinase [Mucilaginibacter myungsuensis]
MNTEINNIQPIQFDDTTKMTPQPFDLKATLRRYLYHWPLFLIFAAVSGAGAFYYLLHAKPVYIINAKLMIKDNTTKTNEEIALKQLSETEQPKGVESEIELLRSKTSMLQIVNNLQLWVTYQQKGKYVSKDLYGQSPVKFELTDPGKYTTGTISIVVDDSDSYHVVSGTNNGPKLGFGQPVKNNVGGWHLTATENVKNFIGRSIMITLADTNQVADQYLTKLKMANPDKNVPIVYLTIEDEAPGRGINVLDQVITEYHKEAALAKKRATKNTLDFIDARLGSLTGELNGVERNVEEFKSSRGLTDIAADSKASVDNFQDNDKRLNEINVQLEVVRNIERYINSGIGDGESPPSTIGIADQTLTNLVDQLTDLQLEKSKLLATTPAGNPIFVPLNRQINSTREALRQSVGSIRTSLTAIKGQLLSNNSRFQSTIKGVPGQERQLVGIKRQQGSKENLYEYLLQKREEVALDYAATIPAATTVETANFGGLKSSKNNLVIAMAFMFALAGPVGLILARDAVSSVIINQNSIINYTKAPVISEIMQNDSSSPEMILSKPRYIIGEQFRDLRTKLNYLHNKKPKGRVTLFTSSIAGEGKSFVATNLAVTLAAAKRKTILLELDMRIPKIHQILNLDTQHAGLTSYLNGEATLSDIIQPTALHPDLYVITTGAIPENPSELLETNRMTDLIEFLKLEYDDILIDSPPVHLVTDAMILADLCDVTLYVVRQAFTPSSELAFIKRTYAEKKLPNMNIIFNGVEKEGKYSYGYNLYSNYYNNEKTTKAHSNWKTFFSRF